MGLGLRRLGLGSDRDCLSLALVHNQGDYAQWPLFRGDEQSHGPSGAKATVKSWND